ncbi:hypothetical protein [Allocoleopsis sp.]
MPDFTYSADDLRQLADEEVGKGNFDAAQELADNANETESAQSNEQS